MAAYVIINLTVKDPEAYKEYIAKAPAFIAKHGGEYLVRGPEDVRGPRLRSAEEAPPKRDHRRDRDRGRGVAAYRAQVGRGRHCLAATT